MSDAMRDARQFYEENKVLQARIDQLKSDCEDNYAQGIQRGLHIAAEICDKAHSPQHKEWANWMASNCAALIRTRASRPTEDARHD